MKRQENAWLLLGLVVLVLILAGLFVMYPRVSNGASESGLGPIGGPSIAQDVNTLVGQKSPSFSLRDARGEMHTVVPGEGHTVLLIFHMGRF